VIVQSSDKEVRAASRAGGWGRHIGEGFDRGKGEIPEYGSCAARGNRGGGRCGGNDTVTDWGDNGALLFINLHAFCSSRIKQIEQFASFEWYFPRFIATI
jgi:hypothetical protein